MELLSAALTFNEARQVSRGLADFVHIYVDDSQGELVGFFSQEIPEELLDLILSGDKETAILKLEMVAISVAVSLWKFLITARRQNQHRLR